MPENTIISSSANFSRQLDQSQQRLQSDGSRATVSEDALTTKTSASEPVAVDATLSKEALALTLANPQQVKNASYAAEVGVLGDELTALNPAAITNAKTSEVNSSPGNGRANLQPADNDVGNPQSDLDVTLQKSLADEKFNSVVAESRGTLIDIFS